MTLLYLSDRTLPRGAASVSMTAKSNESPRLSLAMTGAPDPRCRAKGWNDRVALVIWRARRAGGALAATPMRSKSATATRADLLTL